MRMLVTGGAGFIGSHVLDQMILRDHHVTVVDNLSTGRLRNMSARSHFLKADIRDVGRIRMAFARTRPEVVIHLAAQSSVRASIRAPAFDANTNITGGIHVLEACIKCGVRRFIFASSGGAIYGNPDRLPCLEDTPPRPVSPYGIAKLALEHYAAYFHAVHGLQIVNLRLANIYGPRQDKSCEAGVVAILARRMIGRKTPLIIGDGRQTRDYLYVEDAARAFVLAISGSPGTYNVGTGLETSVNDLGHELACLTSFTGNIRHGLAIAGEVRRIALDCGRARQGLGWAHSVGLRDGLARTVQHLRGCPKPGM